MIIFKEIRYQNILSTGNFFTTIPLNQSKTTLIVGENGAGKSTILDALAFALYGKPFRKINKPQLMNSINSRDLLVELDFSIGANKYTIRRGMRPNIFEVYENDDLLNQDAAARDYQQYLEDNILKMNFKSFGQIVVLGSSTFVPFMQLPAGHRREIIEDLLDIQIFTVMNTLLKEKLAQNKSDLRDAKYQIDIVQERISAANKHNASIIEMKQADAEKIQSRIDSLLAENDSLLSEASNIQEELHAMQKSISDHDSVTKKMNELIKIENNLTNKTKTLAKTLAFYEENDQCPTCKQGIDTDHKHHVISTNEEKIQEINDALEKLVVEKDKVNQRILDISEINTEITEKNLEVGNRNASISVNERTISSLKSDLQTAKEEIDQIDESKIDELKAELKDLEDSGKQLYLDGETMGVTAMLLKDGGIKTQIIRQYVPIMNKLINKYLAEMDFFVQFELDEQFNETIRSRFRDDFSYESFSEGEKMRIDLALLFTWRAVSKLRNSTSTNLLIMDEVFDGSLDINGTEEFMKIINDITGDSNIFIISHKTDQLIDRFDSVLRFEKVKNFSKIA